MKVRVVTPSELGSDEQRVWEAIQERTPALASPYFRPEFARAVGASRDDARVGVIEIDGATAGFFPFFAGRLKAGRPLGTPISDYQGVVIGTDVEWKASDLLRGCGLTSFSFDHLIVSQKAFRPFHAAIAESPIIDLSAGFDGWRDERRSAGSNRIGQLERKGRKIARELGPTRFAMHEVSQALFQRVIDWKSEQCRRTGVHDFFGEPWVRACVERILHANTPGFSGVLSSLHAGDQLVAAHLGMRSHGVLHWWFPVYDRALGRYSPGGLLLLHLAKAAAEQAVRTIDLGKGDDAYKASFQNGTIELAEGLAHLPSLSAGWRRTRRVSLRLARRSRSWLGRRIRGGPRKQGG